MSFTMTFLNEQSRIETTLNSTLEPEQKLF